MQTARRFEATDMPLLKFPEYCFKLDTFVGFQSNQRIVLLLGLDGSWRRAAGASKGT